MMGNQTLGHLEAQGSKERKLEGGWGTDPRRKEETDRD